MKRVVLSCYCLFSLCFAFAQSESTLDSGQKPEQKQEVPNDNPLKSQKLKINGYIQAEYQHGEKDAKLNVGAINENLNQSFSRIGVRRARLKFTYEEGIASGVIQLDASEKEISLKDAYLNIQDPWLHSNAFRAGIFYRPFGYEISYSSSVRESPERSMIFRTLFPDERDLGGMLSLQAPSQSSWHFLKLEAGWFAGNGIKEETDNKRDFIGHLSIQKDFGSDIKLGLGVSYYNGGVFQGTPNVYAMHGKSFVLNSDSNNIGQFAKREYVGFDAQYKQFAPWGMIRITGEYLFGLQPGNSLSSRSPNLSIPEHKDTYIRPFNGGYLMLAQDIGKLPFSAVLKYDWYDPNTNVKKNDIGLLQTSAVDLLQSTWGFGVLWRPIESVCLTAYYEIHTNETSQNLNNYKTNIPDDVFTLRLQYKF